MNKKLLFGLLACLLLTVVLSACKIVNADTIPQNPAVNMGASNFVVATVTIKKGQSLNLVDQAASRHVILNGFWDASGKEHAQTETGAPTVNATTQGNDSATVGPFNTAGTFKIYCNIHQGMNLAITVQ